MEVLQGCVYLDTAGKRLLLLCKFVSKGSRWISSHWSCWLVIMKLLWSWYFIPSYHLYNTYPNPPKRSRSFALRIPTHVFLSSKVQYAQSFIYFFAHQQNRNNATQRNAMHRSPAPIDAEDTMPFSNITSLALAWARPECNAKRKNSVLWCGVKTKASKAEDILRPFPFLCIHHLWWLCEPFNRLVNMRHSCRDGAVRIRF